MLLRVLVEQTPSTVCVCMCVCVHVYVCVCVRERERERGERERGCLHVPLIWSLSLEYQIMLFSHTDFN